MGIPVAVANTIMAVSSIVGATSSVATGIAGTVMQKKSLDEQEDQLKDQAARERKARAEARKAANATVDGGFSGTILAPQGLGGQSAASGGKATLLGGG